MHPVQIYSASAGSGKTFTLVREYLKVLFTGAQSGDYTRFRQVLAVTFTNKATAEMKQRILQALQEIARDEETPMLESLKTELPQLNGFAGHAHRLLLAILRDYTKFNIQTIDSFFQDIVRSVARELDLPLNYEVETDTEKGLQFAVEEVFREIGVDEDLTRWLESYALTLMQSGKSWDFHDRLKNFGEEVFNDSIDLGALGEHAAHMKDLQKRLNAVIADMDTRASALGLEILRLVDESGIPEKALNTHFLNALKTVTTGLDGLSVPPGKNFIGVISGDLSALPKKNEKEFGAAMKGLEASAYGSCLNELHNLVSNELGIYLAAREARNNIYAVGVVNRINHHLKRYRRERNTLFLADAARLIKGFIQLSDTPFLFEKTGSRITHLFIDEFQDTSTLQWHNVLPVLHHLLSTANNRMAVTLVGDAKQSIYRWRGGDFRLITGLAAETLAPYESTLKNLDTNRRSLPGIVEFNNSFFGSVIQLMDAYKNEAVGQAVEQAYAGVSQLHLPSPLAGHVSVDFLHNDEVSTWKDLALQNLEVQLRQLRAAGYLWSDIAILVRRRSEGVEISRFLQGLNIEVLSAETLLLKFDRDVQLLLAGLYYVHQPDTALYYVNLLWHYTRKHKLGAYPKSVIFADHHHRALLAELLPGLSGKLHQWREMHVWQLVELLVRELGLEGDEQIFLSQFRQLAYDFSKNQSPLVGEFLAWWEEEKEKASVQLEAGGDRVHIMTIHKSKGLEFPAVIIPFGDWPVHEKLHEQLLWPADGRLLDGMQLPVRATKAVEASIFGPAVAEERSLQWIDSLNLLYVAFTRARETLLVTCPAKEANQRLPVHVSELIGDVISSWGQQEDERYVSGKLERPDAGSRTDQAVENSPSPAVAPKKPLGFHLADTSPQTASRVGEVVHRAASFYGHKPAGEAFRKALEEAYCSRTEESDAQRHFQALSGNAELNNWMAHARHIWSEQDIWFDGRLLRPDKVIRLEERMVVVDFKTGEPLPAHKMQVADYVRAIGESFPGETVEGYILYTDSGRMEKLA